MICFVRNTKLNYNLYLDFDCICRALGFNNNPLKVELQMYKYTFKINNGPKPCPEMSCYFD